MRYFLIFSEHRSSSDARDTSHWSLISALNTPTGCNFSLNTFRRDLSVTLEAQQLSALDEVLDLSAVKVDSPQLFQISIDYIEHFPSHVVDKVLPELPPCLGGEIGVR